MIEDPNTTPAAANTEVPPSHAAATAALADIGVQTIQRLGDLLAQELRYRRLKQFAIIIAFTVFASAWVSSNLLGQRLSLSAKDRVVVVPVTGAMNANGQASADTLVPIIDTACRSSATRALILRINSGGGSPSDAERIISAVNRCQQRKIVVKAVIERIGASAAYLLAISTDEVIAQRYAQVGSIGAVISTIDASDGLSRLGIRQRVYASGDLKSVGSPLSAPTPREEALLTSMAEQAGAIFREQVQQQRKAKLKADRDMFSGRTWIAPEAMRLGLIDRIAVYEDVLASDFPTLAVSERRPERDLRGQLGLEQAVGEHLIDRVLARLSEINQ